MIFIFLFCHETAHDNKGFSRKNSKPHCESQITTCYVELWKRKFDYALLFSTSFLVYWYFLLKWKIIVCRRCEPTLPPIWPILLPLYIFSKPPTFENIFFFCIIAPMIYRVKTKINSRESYFFMFRRLQTSIAFFFYKQHFHVFKGLKRKINIVNERLAE